MKQLLKRLALCVVTLALVCGLTPVAFAAGADYYDIYLETQGGFCDELMVFAYKFGNGYYYLNELPTPTLEGYRFEGWYDDQVGGKKVTQLYNFKGDTTLYAHWRADPTATAAAAGKTDTTQMLTPVETTVQDKVIAWTIVGVTVAAATLVLVLTNQ